MAQRSVRRVGGRTVVGVGGRCDAGSSGGLRFAWRLSPAARSLERGEIVPSIAPKTIADGLLTSLGELTFAVIRRRVERIVTVDEEAIAAAMRQVWERMKIVIEPSSAVPIAALLAGEVDVAGRRVGVIVSGGNVDLTRLPWSA